MGIYSQGLDFRDRKAECTGVVTDAGYDLRCSVDAFLDAVRSIELYHDCEVYATDFREEDAIGPRRSPSSRADFAISSRILFAISQPCSG